MKIRLTLQEEALGMRPVDPTIFATFIASRHPSGTPQRDELETPESKEEKGTCVWPLLEDGKTPFMYDYQFKGMFKESAKACRMMDDCKTKEVPAYKTKIDLLIFPRPRIIPFKLPEGAELGVCERSMRVETPQGPRTCLARSITIPKETTINLEIDCREKALWPFIREWLDYGKDHGLGQWRNSGKGVYTWEVLEKKDSENMEYRPYKAKKVDSANE